MCLLHGAGETLRMLRKTSQVSGGRGCQYHKSCHLPPTTKRPLHWNPSWLRGVCTHREGSCDKLALETKQDNWPEGKQRPGSTLINVLTSKSHNSYSSLSAFVYTSFCMYSTCVINTLLSSIPSVPVRIFFSKWTVAGEHQFFGVPFFMFQLSHPYMITGKCIALTIWTFVGKVMCHFLICCLGWS